MSVCVSCSAMSMVREEEMQPNSEQLSHRGEKGGEEDGGDGEGVF